MNKNFEDYYLGLDIGTDSVGWAVTDLDYRLLKFNGKSMWGSRLFDEAKTAKERRLFRTARRRTQRRVQRIKLLQELFAEEICKKDEAFFIRMSESAYKKEDKSLNQTNTLFNDKDFTDSDYHKLYPSIYHLRYALMRGDVLDVRLVYLALHHIIKNRGHFLFEGDLGEITDFENIYFDLCQILRDELEIELELSKATEFEEILKDKSLGKKAKSDKLSVIIGKDTSSKKAVALAMSGCSFTLNNLFDSKEYDSTEYAKISFSESKYDEHHDDIADILQEKMYVVDKLKAVYDWALLSEILSGKQSLSEAKIAVYDKHKKDLAILKKAVKEYAPDKYDDIFKEKKKDNYVAYTGKAPNVKVIPDGKCSQEELNKFIEKTLGQILKENESDEDLVYLKNELANRSLLPKQVNKDNSVIPYQLHLFELERILDNAKNYLPFLSQKDSTGYTVCEKIVKLFKFRIPYYVGPLNTAHKKENDADGFCWMVRKAEGRILPWNFEDMVDTDKSAERFIKRMTNKCTYLIGEDVLPKYSLLYSEFAVLNELNNLRINGESISLDVKKLIYEKAFKVYKKVSIKRLKSVLENSGKISKDDPFEISGIDNEFKNSLSSFIDLKSRIGDKVNNRKMTEDIIKYSTLFGDETKLFKHKLSAEYGDVLTKEEINSLSKLKYSGWGRLSEKFLTGIYHITDENTGECMNIIEAMYNTNYNLMQLLSSDFSYKEKVDIFNKENSQEKASLTYDTVAKLYVSPSVKRSIWQTLCIVDEIKSVTKKNPKKIFIEVTRKDREKKRTKSRKDRLLELYKSCGKECEELLKELNTFDEASLRSDKLYLYFMQMGRCMYSGSPIELSDLLSGDRVYDIDHIFPQCRVKDDSLNNRVLVKKTLNEDKGDKYPIKAEWQSARKPFWNMLKARELISDIKYERLTRTTPFSDNELADFIARQLVETSQSVKAVAEILNEVFEDSRVVYVKAGNVSRFRDEFKFVKVRDVNDLHHAKDAYLNIVVGNVYDTKFTQNPLNYIRNRSTKDVYSLNRMFDYDVVRNSTVAWKAGEENSIATVKKVMAKNNPLITRYSYEKHGAIANMQLSKKGIGKLPIKGKGPLSSLEYGGYDDIRCAYFMLVKHILKEKEVKTMEFVHVHLSKKLENNPDAQLEYLVNDLGLVSPEILIDKIKIGALLEIDGFRATIASKNDEKTLNLRNAMQLVLNDELCEYVKKVGKFVARLKAAKGNLSVSSHDGITFEDNVALYETFIDKLKNTKYCVKLLAQISTLENKKQVFTQKSLEEQAEILFEILKMFQCNALTSDLSLLGGGKGVAKIRKNKKIDEASIYIIHQSPTGLFEQRVDLNRL